MKPTIALIGATGKAGKYILPTLLQQGYPVKVLIRNPAAFTAASPSITVIQGDANRAEDIARLLAGCEAVISALGQPGNPGPVFSKATGNIIQAMPAAGVSKYLLITGLSIDLPGDAKSERVQQLSAWMRQQYPGLIADKQREYELLAGSTVDWTIVRLPVIVQTDKQYPLAVSLTDCPGEKISATDIAHFLIGQLNNDVFLRQAPFIANTPHS